MDEKFNKIVKHVQDLGNKLDYLSDNDKLKIYSLFKRATVGKCSEKGGKKPWKIEFKKRSKWDAWNKLNDMSESDAKEEYINFINDLLTGTDNEFKE